MGTIYEKALENGKSSPLEGKQLDSTFPLYNGKIGRFDEKEVNKLIKGGPVIVEWGQLRWNEAKTDVVIVKESASIIQSQIL